MPFKTLFLLLPALALAVFPCRAQNLADIPAPKPPLVAAVPDPADWTITLIHKPGAAASPSPSATAAGSRPNVTLLEVHSTRSGKYRRDVLAYSDGKKNTQWVVDQFILWATPEGQISAIDLRSVQPVDPHEPDPSSPEGFPGTRWLQPAYYDKAVLIDKRPCYHFVHGAAEAWIDVETRLPVLYKSGEFSYQYKFGQPPVEPLVLPPDFQKMWDRILQVSKRRQLLEGGPVVHR